MPNYLVIIEDRIYCEGRVRVNADNAAEAAQMALCEAEQEEVEMTPMENGSQCPRVYRIVNEDDGIEVARIGDGWGKHTKADCLTTHPDELIKFEKSILKFKD